MIQLRPFFDCRYHMHALTRQQVRQIDQTAIETLGIPGVILMENAGRQCADVAAEMLDQFHGQTVAVVCGSGNNGGDGYVLARHLDLRGFEVETFLVVPPDKITGDALVNLNAIKSLGHDICSVNPDELSRLGQSLSQFDLVVDAVGGTGIRGALRGDIATAVEQINAAGRPVLAVDIPTGLDCDTGQAEGPVVRAAMTVTFVARKKGFDCPESSDFTGLVRVADIGIPPEVVAKLVDS